MNWPAILTKKEQYMCDFESRDYDSLALNLLSLRNLLTIPLIIWIRFYSQERLFGARSYAPSNLTA